MTMLHANATHRSLALVRTLVLGIWMLLANNVDIAFYAEIPFADLQQAGLFGLLPESIWHRLMSNATALRCIQYALTASCLAAMLGLLRLPSLCAASVLVILQETIVRQSGVVYHETALAQYLLFTLTFFEFVAWRRHRKSLKPAADAPTILLVMATIMTLTYAITGVRRIAQGGTDLFFSDILGYWLIMHGHDGIWGEMDWNFSRVILQSRVLYALLWMSFVIVTALEITLPLALFNQRFRQVALPILLVFHLAILLTMDIYFFENIVLLILLLDFSSYRGIRWAFKPSEVTAK